MTPACDGQAIDDFASGGGRGDDVIEVGVFGGGFMVVDVDGEQAVRALEAGALETVALEDDDAVIVGGDRRGRCGASAAPGRPR